MRYGRGGRKLKRAGPPSPPGESAAVGGDASRPLAGAGRSSPDLVDLSTTEVHAGKGGTGTSMAALVPLGVARSRPRRHRGITLQEAHPLSSVECSEPPVNQKRKKTCGKGKRSTNRHTTSRTYPRAVRRDCPGYSSSVPVKSLLRCKSVCKGWRDIITDPFFVRAHLQHSASRCEQDPCLVIAPFTLDHLFNSNHICFYQWQQGASMATLMHEHDKDIGSEFKSIGRFAQYDGLVLVPTDTRLYLFNPATRETITLPDRDNNQHHSSIRACFCTGLGLDPRTGKHKVVWAFYRSIDPYTGLGTDMGMEVITVSGNSNGGGSAWREIKDDLPYPAANWNTGTAVNGFLFWHLDYKHRDLQCPWGLLCLSLADETFGITMLPDSVRPDSFGLDVLHGELCMSAHICKDTVTMWFLPIQEDGGQGQTWEQRYTVHLTCVYRPLAFLPCGQMLLYTYPKVCLYDMSTAKLTTVCQVHRMKYQGRRAGTWKNIFTFNIHPYTESLVRLSV